MPVYRVLYISVNGETLKAEDVECLDDDHVIERTGDDYTGRIEIWEADRLVAKYPLRPATFIAWKDR
jgi:hypothetical protein